ncbi:MAG: sensor histidine kinase [Nannocystis sp.]|nr:sensor histidine kinase [Nannocystis sp.]MBA3546299.1 sensor histidine kinase [Nannocystis sp.]
MVSVRAEIRRSYALLRSACDLRHLRMPADVTAADDAAFTRHAVELAADYVVLGAGVMMVAILVWWPVDALVWSDTHYLAELAAMRVHGLIVMGTALALFLGSRQVRRASRLGAPLVLAALLVCIGHALGRINGTDLSWFADAIFGVLTLALVPMRFGPRVAATLLVAFSLPAGFVAADPRNIHTPGLGGQLSFLVFAAFATVVVGEMTYRVVRRGFLQQLALSRARAALAATNSSLAGRLGEQTRDLRLLAGQLERVHETERSRLARELHDELGQELTAMRYTLARLDAVRDIEPGSVGLLVSDLMALLDGTTTTVRAFLAGLRPSVLDELGLVAAAEWLRDRVRKDVECRLTVGDGVPALADRLDPELALNLFRGLQEATTNAWRHAHARTITIELDVEADEITAQVRDDGVGFDTAVPSAGLGLLGLRERMRDAGGRLTVDSAPGHGTRVALTVPARRALPDEEPLR